MHDAARESLSLTGLVQFRREVRTNVGRLTLSQSCRLLLTSKIYCYCYTDTLKIGYFMSRVILSWGLLALYNDRF